MTGRLNMALAEKTYLFKVLIAIDYFFSTVFLRDPNITISAKVGLAMREKFPPLWARILHTILNNIQKDHCELAILGDTARLGAAYLILTGKQIP
jgi:hypothetical protein